MSKKKKIIVDDMSILEAVDNLTSIAELNEIHEGTGNQKLAASRWLDEDREDASLTKVKQTFRVVHNYLKDVYVDKKEGLKSQENQKGVQAIMSLAGEAADKLDKYTNMFKGMNATVSELEEFQDLQKFYNEKLAKRFKSALKSEDAWQEEWGSGEDDHLDIQRRGLRDLETVKRDQRYELFYLNKEDGRPFFNRNLIRHIKLVNDFDSLFANIEHSDPFMKLNLVVDKDLHASAKQIRDQVNQYLSTFFRSAHNEMQTEMVTALYSALSALSLATASHNQVKNSSGKSCSLYFNDFRKFIRRALTSNEYYHNINLSEELADPLTRSVIRILHHVAFRFFTRVGYREEAIGLIHTISKHKPSKDRSHKSSLAFWNELLDMHEAIQDNLKKFPNGPLFKTIDVFRERDELGGFDPLSQHNNPSSLYQIESKKLNICCLRTPCPTHQTVINEAHVAGEFQAFVRELQERKKVYLLFNLQDRTSWEESARCTALEEMQANAEIADTLWVVTVPKFTDFYHQANDYLEVTQSKDFIATYTGQIDSLEECGYSLPHRVSKGQIQEFMRKSITFVHKHMFGNKKVLTRKNRLDFIELMNQLFYLKAIEILSPDYISFTCKDSVDTGVAAASGFYALLKMLSIDPIWSGEEHDFFHWMVFSPALTIRERSISNQRLSRMVSMLSLVSADLEEEGSKLTCDLQKLFSKEFLQNLRVKPDDV
jgi:hypothetical protein